MMEMNEAWVARQEESDESRRFHERERLAVWTMDALAGLMEDKGISKAELARKIGCSRAHVTQLFSGSRNPTLGTIADLAWALGSRACVRLEPLREGRFMSVPVQPVQPVRIPHIRFRAMSRQEETACLEAENDSAYEQVHCMMAR